VLVVDWRLGQLGSAPASCWRVGRPLGRGAGALTHERCWLNWSGRPGEQSQLASFNRAEEVSPVLAAEGERPELNPVELLANERCEGERRRQPAARLAADAELTSSFSRTCVEVGGSQRGCRLFQRPHSHPFLLAFRSASVRFLTPIVGSSP
jgi:hypothetical protein